METKNSKVTAVTLKKSGTGQHGAYFIFTVVFENGDTGDFVSKANPQTKFTVGQTTDYTKEVVQNGQYTNIKIGTVQANGGGFKPQNPIHANRRTALESASKMRNVATETDAIRVAEIFLKWLNESPPQAAAAPIPTPLPVDEIPEWLR